mmetsp:Transcript_34997/g.48528  ORF Transcript_34997/g.48528 Transcript_34997/m.48528 type:complete len:95 (-) Transcript_34997:312-596(-)
MKCFRLNFSHMNQLSTDVGLPANFEFASVVSCALTVSGGDMELARDQVRPGTYADALTALRALNDLRPMTAHCVKKAKASAKGHASFSSTAFKS